MSSAKNKEQAMSANSRKGGLTVGGPAFDKSKLHQNRLSTPDSEALASSDEERDHVPPSRLVGNPAYPVARRQSSGGWTQDISKNPTRKFSASAATLPTASFAASNPSTPSFETVVTRPPVTTTPSFPWNTPNFAAAGPTSNRTNQPLPSPTSLYQASAYGVVSPEKEEPRKILLTQNTSVRKAVRSQSYSVGQGDVDNSVLHHNQRSRASLRHRESTPRLSQLHEVDSDEVESSNGSDQTVRPQPDTYDRERRDHNPLLRQLAEGYARNRHPAASSSSPSGLPRKHTQYTRASTMSYSDHAIEEPDDGQVDSPKLGITRRFSEAVAGLGRNVEPELMASPTWVTGNATALGIDPMSRRHSFAHVGSHTPTSFHMGALGNTQEEDEEISPHDTQSPPQQDTFEVSGYFNGTAVASHLVNTSAISVAHPDPAPPRAPLGANPYAVPNNFGRPSRRLFVVAFKCSRAEVYFIYDNTGLEVRAGDLVIVEGDRGCDLGQVTHANVSLDDAKKYKNEANQEHLRWLVMFSQYSLAGSSGDNPMLGALARAGGFPNNFNRSQLSGMGVQQDQEFKPKMIKRLAQQHEIQSLRDKEGQEAKAKRQCANKAQEHGFQMEILDAELQADHHKLTFYYYAETYVNFNALVADLFKQYKIRIWMSAVNPASVVNPNGQSQIQPPSAIGPGAIVHSRTPNAAGPVGGFGNNAFSGATRPRHGQGNAFGEGQYAFSQQLPQYPLAQNAYGQNAYPMQFGHQNVYGGYYPPAYSASNVGGTTYYGTSAPGNGAASSGKNDPSSAMSKLNLGN